jgi:molecular chaperone DnaK (HSP70)
MTSVMIDESAAVDRVYPKVSTVAEDGIWVGVDFGTSNSSCAVWDSAGGRSKWMRFPRDLAQTTLRDKRGRTMPSVVLYDTPHVQLVGQAAIHIVDTVLDAESREFSTTRTPYNDNDHYNDKDVAEALVTSVKRIFGMTPQQIQQNDDFFLPFSIETRNGEVVLCIRPLKDRKVMYVTPLQVTTIILREIKRAAQSYMDRDGLRKQLQVPGNHGNVRNCVIGVPAHFGRSQRKLIEQACHDAGWDGHVSTITESTAAAMAYGLFVSSSLPCKTKHILVFDMGGGTTDLTICEMGKQQQQQDTCFRVLVALGDQRLGGNDMDESLLQLILKKKHNGHQQQDQIRLTIQQRRCLLGACRRGKELLCGNADEPPANSCTIMWDKQRIEVTQEEFNTCIEHLISRARILVHSALERYASSFTTLSATDDDDDDDDTAVMDEVVLVGGATRVPAVRSMLQQVFPSLELCTSINATSAVAQGAAIQAALVSGLVPKHELRSAMMLDALPHSIGVELDNGEFLPILEKDTLLPAMGYATFELADVHQPGVTVVAVEDVGDDDELPVLERIGVFSFLLRRLSDPKLEKLHHKKRSVDIGMTMEPSGEFIVSIFDQNDPEHVEKKRRYQQHKHKSGGGSSGVELLGYHDNNVPTDKGNVMTREEKIMMASSVLLLVIYIVVKLVFHDPLKTRNV